MFKRLTVDTYFNTHSAAYARIHNAERGIELNDRRLATFINAKNGVTYYDDTVEGGQRQYMQHDYDQWDYENRKGLFWQREK